jgi:3-oxoacyl-[acyl-carrier-protein] synthase II
VNGKRVVVTGIGAVCPRGLDVVALADVLETGKGAPVDSDVSGRISGFHPERHIHPNRLRRMDALSARAVAAALLSVRDARLAEHSRTVPRPDTGVAFGTAYGCQETTLRYAQKLVEQGAYFTNPIDFPDSIDGAPAAHVAMELGLQGPSTTHVDGALSGEVAVWHAVLAIQSGRAARMIAGAGDTWTHTLHDALTDLGLVGGSTGGAESPARAETLRLSEGVAMLVLESAASAAARGARVYAEVLGVAAGADPACPPHRFPAASTGIVDTMTRALGAAGLGPTDVDRISTAAGAAPDESDAEVEAMRELGGSAWHDRWVALGSRLGCFDSAGALRLAAACVTVGRSGADTPRRILHHALSRGGQSLSLVVGRP